MKEHEKKVKINKIKKVESLSKPTAKESKKDISLTQSLVNMDRSEALNKFKEEFKANKKKRLREELRNIDLI